MDGLVTVDQNLHSNAFANSTSSLLLTIYGFTAHTTATRLTIFLIFGLPYLGSISHHIEKELHQFPKANITYTKANLKTPN